MTAFSYEKSILLREPRLARAKFLGWLGEIHKILVPMDFASDYKAIIPWVKDLANRFNATIYLLYVSYYPTFYVNINLESYEAEVQVAAKKQMSTIIEDFFNDFSKLEARLEFGQPAEKILEVAENEKIDMVIMGMSNRKATVFGSVSLKVVQSALCPVVIVCPLDSNIPQTEPTPFGPSRTRFLRATSSCLRQQTTISTLARLKKA
jgi:nucleotide-binding universal stress UspA family protein